VIIFNFLFDIIKDYEKMLIERVGNMNSNMTVIEERIKNLRERNMITQKELANKMNISRNLICLWENGYANISLRQIIKYSYIYNVSLDYVLGIIDNPDNKKYKFIKKLDLKYVGTKIREIRKSLNMTQEKFATKIDTKRSSISYYESGKMMISTADLKQICETFGYSSDYIVGNIKTCIRREIKNKLKAKDIKEFITN